MLEKFLDNMLACREQNILISNPRVLFETLGHQIPQSFKVLDEKSATELAGALDKFNKIMEGSEPIAGQITNRDGSKGDMIATIDRAPAQFNPNRFHYTQGMELFTVPNAKVEGDVLDIAGSISATKPH